MSENQTPRTYKELVQGTATAQAPPSQTAEEQLDSLIEGLKRSEGSTTSVDLDRRDPIQWLRELTINTLIPAFVELVEKYSKSGIEMQMDASNFLEGGREIKFEFTFGDYQTQLHGTVTTEAIAFHETRHSPVVHGELVSGPMLRLRGLNGEIFRDFVCERLALLLRAAARRR